MQFLANYGLFIAKTLTLAITILMVFAGILALLAKGKDRPKERLEVKKLNDKYEEMAETLSAEVLAKEAYKKFLKEQKKASKAKEDIVKKRVFVLDFDGDIKASEVMPLSEEITAILTIATPEDEVVVRLESPGGLVYAYGLGASQLQRIRDHNIMLTVAVDKVAASGGYLMACVANNIIAAPFAIIGSIGVLAQLPNFHRLLKKNYIDFEQVTAGEHKRTITMFGENTDKGRKKFQEELEEVHISFKDFIAKHRPEVDVDSIATGEHWLAEKAIEFKLVDKLITSDDYLFHAAKDADIFEVGYSVKMSLTEKLSSALGMILEKGILSIHRWTRIGQFNS